MDAHLDELTWNDFWIWDHKIWSPLATLGSKFRAISNFKKKVCFIETTNFKGSKINKFVSYHPANFDQIISLGWFQKKSPFWPKLDNQNWTSAISVTFGLEFNANKSEFYLQMFWTMDCVDLHSAE